MSTITSNSTYSDIKKVSGTPSGAGGQALNDTHDAIAARIRRLARKRVFSPYGVPVAKVGVFGQDGSTYINLGGGLTSFNSSFSPVFAANCSHVRLMYLHGLGGSPDSIAHAATITGFDASITTANGKKQVYFGGQIGVTVKPGDLVISDPIADYGVAAANGTVQVYGTVAADTTDIPYGLSGATAQKGSANQSQGTITGGTNIAGGPMLGYTQLLGIPEYLGLPCVLIVGDSIQVYPSGYVISACTAASIPYICVAKAGEGAQPALQTARWMRIDVLGRFCTHAVSTYGRNDIYAAAPAGSDTTLITNQTAIAAVLNGLGIEPWIATVTPLTTSTDSWVTAGNQTPAASESMRVAYNNYIRTNYAAMGYAGVLDAADAVDANSSNVLTRNGGRWYCGVSNNTAYTTDGTHPTATGYTAIRTAIQTQVSAFVV